ncbi:hypothetical protein BLNAU_23907 [Blattamonas nauphoetae]|nr:hypothetical protein BLNAU_23907 [Blattamonas nauphoetae]
MIAQGGRNMIAQGGRNMIAQGGRNMIAQGGRNMISDGDFAHDFQANSVVQPLKTYATKGSIFADDYLTTLHEPEYDETLKIGRISLKE